MTRAPNAQPRVDFVVALPAAAQYNRAMQTISLKKRNTAGEDCALSDYRLVIIGAGLSAGFFGIGAGSRACTFFQALEALRGARR